MIRVRIVVLLAAGALLAGVLVLSGGGDGADEAELSAGPSSLVLEGRGYGHGRGLSQHGARGGAEQGKSHLEILDFYYPGTAWGEQGGPIKVRISDAKKAIKIKDRSRLKAKLVGSSKKWKLNHPRAKKWRLKAKRGGKKIRISVRIGKRWRKVRNVRGEVQVKAGGKPIKLKTKSGWRSYRGKLRLAEPRTARDTVNILSVEKYLRGVVPREMPATWHPEAVMAQAVAARTYAFYERAHPRGSHFDVHDTVASQVYGGADDEHRASTKAIKATKRRVLTYGGEIAFTQFSASNGGWTVAGDPAYQVAQQDPWDGYTWEATVSASTIEKAYPSIGDFEGIEVLPSDRDGNGVWGGRVLSITVKGSTGEVTVDGTDFRFAVGLKSTWFNEPPP